LPSCFTNTFHGVLAISIYTTRKTYTFATKETLPVKKKLKKDIYILENSFIKEAFVIFSKYFSDVQYSLKLTTLP
jgi:hypothetical protein